jgi:hypothetical protein
MQICDQQRTRAGSTAAEPGFPAPTGSIKAPVFAIRCGNPPGRRRRGSLAGRDLVGRVLSLIGRRQLLQSSPSARQPHYSRLLKKPARRVGLRGRWRRWKRARALPTPGAGWATTGVAAGGVGTASGASSATSRLFRGSRREATKRRAELSHSPPPRLTECTCLLGGNHGVQRWRQVRGRANPRRALRAGRKVGPPLPPALAGLATGSPELVVANTAGKRGHGQSDPRYSPGRLLQALLARRSRPWVVTRPCSSIAIRWRFPTVWERKRR